jgi:hypothetical protein
MKFCASCRAVITRMRADARYCSDTCRQRGHRAKGASDETAPARPLAAPWTAATFVSPRNTVAASEGAPAPALGPRDRRTGRVIDIASLIG